MFFFLISCNNKSTEECKTDVRAYEFGREMESWVYLRSSGLSLNEFFDRRIPKFAILSEQE